MWRPSPEQRLDVERLSPGRQEVALVEPQRLQVLHEPVEELDVEPADLVDEAGVLLVDESDQVLDRDRAPGDSRWLSRSIALVQDRQARLITLPIVRSSSSRPGRSRRTARPGPLVGWKFARSRQARRRSTAAGRRIAAG